MNKNLSPFIYKTHTTTYLKNIKKTGLYKITVQLILAKN